MSSGHSNLEASHLKLIVPHAKPAKVAIYCKIRSMARLIIYKRNSAYSLLRSLGPRALVLVEYTILTPNRYHSVSQAMKASLKGGPSTC